MSSHARLRPFSGFGPSGHLLGDLVTLHARWSADAKAMWLGDQHTSGDAGFFLESARPSTARFETLFSNDRLEGVAYLAGSLSGGVAEHAYWDAARDRLPLAQIDSLAPAIARGDRRRHAAGGPGTGNLCLIRSGQDWTDTDGGERRMYLDEVEPVLRAGMGICEMRAERLDVTPTVTCG